MILWLMAPSPYNDITSQYLEIFHMFESPQSGLNGYYIVLTESGLYIRFNKYKKINKLN